MTNGKGKGLELTIDTSPGGRLRLEADLFAAMDRIAKLVRLEGAPANLVFSRIGPPYLAPDLAGKLERAGEEAFYAA